MLEFTLVVVFGVSGWLVGWYSRGYIDKRKMRRGDKKRVKYRILSITYRNENKTQELGRFLWAKEFDDWGEAQAEAKKRTDEDTLKNRFDTEWTVVEAP